MSKQEEAKARIMSDSLIEWFRECGLPTMPEYAVSRVVIDAKAGDAVRVYIELFGTKAMLEMVPPKFSPAQITIVGEGDGTNG